MESGFSLVSLETKVILFCAVDASYPVQTHTCLKRFMKINPDHSGPPIKTMKPVTLFLTAVRIMNLNITILAASIHGSIAILCLATIIVSVKETLQVVSFATFIQIYHYQVMRVMCRANLRYSVQCCAVLRCLSAYTTTEVTLAAGLEKVQQETLSLHDDVSITILTSRWMSSKQH